MLIIQKSLLFLDKHHGLPTSIFGTNNLEVWEK